MRKTIFRLISLMILLAVLMPADQPSRSESRPLSIPSMPFPVIGTVKFNGFYISTNGVVIAHCGNYNYGPALIEVADSKSWYSMSIPGDDPDTVDIKEGCEIGEPITFTIQGETANQSTTWQEVAESYLLDLSYGTSKSVFLPLIHR